MSRSVLLKLAAATALLTLAGCDQRDPYLRTDVWKPTGANAGNIAAMVADPNDLIRGHGTMINDTSEPALAVGHIWSDQPKSFTPGAGGGSGGAGGSGSGGSGGGSAGGSGGSGGSGS